MIRTVVTDEQGQYKIVDLPAAESAIVTPCWRH
jgi:hypothetical protein